MQSQRSFQLISLLIILGAVSRLIPHPHNFAPIGALALFGGTYLTEKRMSFLIPMGAMLISDILLQLINGTGFHGEMIWVYGSMALITCMGFFLRGREQRQTIMVASLTGSMLFFFVTNFGVWTNGGYGYTASGLGECYVAAIPYFRGTVMGDLFYNLVLFGSFALLKRFAPALSK
ncbi:MAG: hypothetical protein LW707_05860 [Sphingobacteriales bacterium]|jgi:hypothetical protein|nr:hypothetical protein [Sphingobacteriales bacterium]